MKIREKIINELDGLSPTDYSVVYEYIWSIKLNPHNLSKNSSLHSYYDVRSVFQSIEGDFRRISALIEKKEYESFFIY